jgi:hypothetical protein
MSTPQIETKIEKLAETTEALLLAIVGAQGTKGQRALHAYDAVTSARQDHKDALREFLAPVLRRVA